MAAFRLLQRHVELLAGIADFRLVTAPLVAHVTDAKSMQVTRRLMLRFEQEGLVESWKRQSGAQGRPEKLFSLSEDGRQLLLGRELLPESVPMSALTGRETHCPDHQLLLNWFRVHLDNVQHVLPELAVDFLDPGSPLCRFGWEAEAIAKQRKAGFVPDGVFRITNSQQGKSLLFFLEIDMGTEPKLGKARPNKDIRRMVTGYQDFLACETYAFWRSYWDTSLNGFRVLVLASSEARALQILDLTRQMRLTNFVWISDERSLTDAGLAGPIWTVGDGNRGQRQSILGPTLSRVSRLREVNP